jgi:hypothetical protein
VVSLNKFPYITSDPRWPQLTVEDNSNVTITQVFGKGTEEEFSRISTVTYVQSNGSMVVGACQFDALDAGEPNSYDSWIHIIIFIYLFIYLLLLLLLLLLL